jgi:transcriptional regulator with XRE-family HTH domain
MKELNQIVTALRAMTQAQRAAVAKRAGLSFEGVQKIAIGQRKNPTYDTVCRLASALRK